MASTAATLRQSAANMRSKIRLSDQEARRSFAAYGSALAIGMASKRTASGEIPLEKLEIFGMPGTLTLAVVGKVGASFMDGQVADYLNGIGDAASIIAISKFAEGREIAGVAGDAVAGRRNRRRLSAARQRAAREEAELEDELAELVGDDD